MRKLAYIFYIAVFFSGCQTLDHTTAPTYSDYQLCDFLTLNWITTSGERMAVISELSKRKLACNGGVPIPDKTGIRAAEPPHPTAPQPSVKQQVVSGGTGFLFSSRDYIITNYHVVKGAGSIEVKFPDGEVIKAKVLAKDNQNDIAVLKLSQSPSTQIPDLNFGDPSKVRPGDKVFTIGYPASSILGKNQKITDGIVSSITGVEDDPTMFQITVPIQPGNSGGPLFNESGEVIGITTASLSLNAIRSLGAVPQNVNYAIKSSFVNNLLTTIPKALLSNRGIVVVPNKPGNSLADFFERVSNNIVLIEAKE